MQCYLFKLLKFPFQIAVPSILNTYWFSIGMGPKKFQLGTKNPRAYYSPIYNAEYHLTWFSIPNPLIFNKFIETKEVLKDSSIVRSYFSDFIRKLERMRRVT